MTSPTSPPHNTKAAIKVGEPISEKFHHLENGVKLLKEQVPFGLHLLDKSNIYLSVNAMELSWLGYTRDELINKVSFPSFLTPDSQQIYTDYLSRRANLKCTDGIELALIAKTGGIIHVTLYMERTLTPGDTQPKYHCVMFNISERKSVEEKLRIAATVFQSREGMMVTDERGLILNVNHSFTTITGYAPHEIIGLSPSTLSSGRHDTDFYVAMWDKLNRIGFWEGELWNQRKDGEVYPAHLTITAVKTPEGIVTNYVGTFSDITTSKLAADKIENLAFYDPLTGLPNRRLLLDRLGHAIDSSMRSGKEGAVLYIDLDDFKTINDTLGHDTGDRLLLQVAKRLAAHIRKGDSIARMGGDEFVVVLEELSQNHLEAATQVEVIAKKILSDLNQPYLIGTEELRNTPSIGATLFCNGEKSIEEILKQADIAMYQAKRSGRNMMCFFDQQMQVDINTHATIATELRRAIDRDQLRLHYQIQVNSESIPLGAEGLIRWEHPARGLMTPDQFIPLAEENGLILGIGKWVLKQACMVLKKWARSPVTSELMLSVNVSPKQFLQADFVDQVQDIIQHYKINPHRLKLEITEGMLLENVEETIYKMNQLMHDGIQFSLDDFGTGYSSLQYLKRLPLSQLKIDQSFVRNLATDNSDQTIVRTIIAMAESLNLGVIAEGVETGQQRQHLLDKGCTHFQGYLFGKPVPIDEFMTQLNSLRIDRPHASVRP